MAVIFHRLLGIDVGVDDMVCENLLAEAIDRVRPPMYTYPRIFAVMGRLCPIQLCR